MKKMIERLCIGSALLAAGCTGQSLSPEAVERDAEGRRVEHGMIVLGRQLEDPYSVENMTKALAELYPTKADRAVLPVTDLYVRFLPEDQAQFDALERLGLLLLDHPMDYEIVREGDYYHDPALADERITWQYAVVPKDFSFPPEIRHEILDACHIPSEEAVTKGADGVDWATVERASYRLTGNGELLAEPEAGERTRAGTSGSGKPAGRITILDDTRGDAPEGVRGVRVSCNSFVKFAHAYTDAEGNYQMTRSFSSKPRYRLVFKNSTGFAIGLNLLLVPASVATLGRNEASGLDVEVTRHSDRRLFSRCVVNNAGYDYYKRCAADSPAIKMPPSNLRIWLFQGLETGSTVMMQQGVMVDGSKLADLLGEYIALVKVFLPDITLGLKGKEDFGSIYAGALHEFAHASHFMLAGRDYWNSYARFILTSFVTSRFVTYGVGTEEDHGYCEVGEMWAYFMQTLLYRERYGTPDAYGLSHWFHPQIFLQLEERGLSCNKIFQVLGADVTDRTVLQKKLISFYPEFKSAINQAFARYN